MHVEMSVEMVAKTIESLALNQKFTESIDTQAKKNGKKKTEKKVKRQCFSGAFVYIISAMHNGRITAPECLSKPARQKSFWGH